MLHAEPNTTSTTLSISPLLTRGLLHLEHIGPLLTRGLLHFCVTEVWTCSELSENILSYSGIYARTTHRCRSPGPWQPCGEAAHNSRVLSAHPQRTGRRMQPEKQPRPGRLLRRHDDHGSRRYITRQEPCLSFLRQ